MRGRKGNLKSMIAEGKVSRKEKVVKCCKEIMEEMKFIRLKI